MKPKNVCYLENLSQNIHLIKTYNFLLTITVIPILVDNVT